MAEKIELKDYLVSQGWYFNPNYRKENYKYRKVLFDNDKYTCEAIFRINDEKNIGTSLSLTLRVNLKQITIPNKHIPYLLYQYLPKMDPSINFIRAWKETLLYLSIDTFRIGLTISPNRLKKLQSIIDKIDSNYIDNFIEAYREAYKESNEAEQNLVNQYIDNGYTLYSNWRDDAYVKKLSTKDFGIVEVLSLGIDARDVRFSIKTSIPCSIAQHTRRNINDEYRNILGSNIRLSLEEYSYNYEFLYIVSNAEEVISENYLNTIKTLSDSNLLNELLNHLIDLYEESSSNIEK